MSLTASLSFLSDPMWSHLLIFHEILRVAVPRLAHISDDISKALANGESGKVRSKGEAGSIPSVILYIKLNDTRLSRSCSEIGVHSFLNREIFYISDMFTDYNISRWS